MDGLRSLADESAHCVVTSPPYWGLRDYGVAGQIGREATLDEHFATFPTRLAETCIKAGCPADGIVLDPFGGSGTTGMVAERLGTLCKPTSPALLFNLQPGQKTVRTFSAHASFLHILTSRRPMRNVRIASAPQQSHLIVHGSLT